MRMSAYECYCLYIALKNHFTQETYDYFKYHGKTNVSLDSFQSRRDRFQFQKLCRFVDSNDMRDFLVANFIKEKKWVGDLLSEEATETFMNYKKRRESLTYHFKNEVENIFFSGLTTDEIFKAGKDYPRIIYDFLGGDISIETMVILDTFIQFSNKYETTYGKDDVIWSRIRLILKKYKPFLDYDKDKIKSIMKGVLNDKRFSSKGQEASPAQIPTRKAS